MLPALLPRISTFIQPRIFAQSTRTFIASTTHHTKYQQLRTMSSQTHDPTAQQASGNASDLTAQQKVDGLMKIVNEVGNAMLTSHSPDGKLASRCMHPATTEGLVFSFFQNSESGKTDDIESNPEVNVSFLNPKGDWASISGKAKINQDKAKVKKYFNKSLEAWFDDKKDGVHTGDENDPRVVMLDVHPDEIRYYSQAGTATALKDMAVAAFSSGVASPGKLVILSGEELAALSKVHQN